MKPIARPIKTIALSLMLAACAAPGQAATASYSGTLQSVVLDPLTATVVEDLDFGHIVTGNSDGTVVIDPVDNSRTTSGGTASAGGAPSAAIFVGVAQPDRMVQLNLPHRAITLTNGNGDSMTVSDFTTDGPVDRQADANGIISFRVAATLNVAANQAEGSYSGTFDIMLNLQ